MSRPQLKQPRRQRIWGLSIAELMISLAISAMLLSAVAAAYSASASAIEMNDQFFRASQSARVSMNKILTELRKCKSADVGTDNIDITNELGKDIAYALSGTDLNMTFIPTGALEPITCRVASNIQTLKFETDSKSVSVLLTVAVGKNQITLSGCAYPRRWVVYK